MHLFRLNDTTTASFCLSNENVFAGDLRLLLVGILGTLVSIVSIGQNLLLFYVFATSRKLRRQNYVNPVLLAFFDIFVSTIYLLISPTHFLAHRLDSATLVSFWAKNMRILYCLEHFALTVCNLLLVIASIERFLANGSLNAQRCVLVFIVRRKPYVIAAIIAFALLLKASLYFEIGLFEVPECANLTASLIPVWLADNGTFAQAFRFWTRNFLTVILPFVILAYCNLRIVQQLRKRRRMTLIGEYSGSLMSQTNQQQQQNGTEKQFVLVAGKKKSQRLLRRLDSSPTQKQWDPTVKLKTNKEKAADFIVKQMPTMEMNGTGGLKRLGGGEGEDVDHGRRITFIRSSDLCFSNSAKRSAIGQPACSSANPSPARNRPKASSASAPPAAAGLGASSAASISSPSSTIGVRVATRTLVMVVGCYLISNSMSTVLNIWEYFDVKFLRHDNFHAYLIASDVAALLTICGCALRFPIYVSNDKRIRKAICRAFIRFRFGCTKAKPETIAAKGEEAEQFLEKYSIVIVSNSLRSNLTGALSQLDWATFRGKRSFDQLAILVQNRRKFLVQMTINLGAVHEMEKSSSKAEEEEEEEEAEGGGEYMEEEEMQRAGTSLTEIHDCTVWEEENEEEEEDEKGKREKLNEKIV